MAEFQKKHSSQNIWYSPLMLFVLLCAVLVFMYNMVDLVEKTHETAKKKDIVLNQITDLQQRETALNSDIGKLSTDAGAEEVLREKYQFVKQGERMVVIVDAQASAGDTIPEKKQSVGFIQFIKNLFK